MTRNLRAAVAALALALMVAPVVSAADVPETLTVNSILQITGLPASINYGAVDPGQMSGQYSYPATVTANSNWSFRLSGSNFAGPATINKSARQAQVGLASGTATVASAAQSWTGFDQTVYDGTSNVVTGSNGSSGFQLELRVNVPSNATAGAYTGTLTWTLSGS